ncbi:hypothetical protein B0H14DRAFT_2652103 [Mycena olivaceomarginata]|nr:hypothetical protein B0H14DRAFT_2652103 [Mycena olivaceomarginata]
MPAKKNKNKSTQLLLHRTKYSVPRNDMLKPRPSTEPATLKLPMKSHDWRCREELSRHAETRWGIDKEYCEVKCMRTYTEHHGLAAPTNCYIPARKLGQAAAFLQLVPNRQMLENEKNSLPPSPSRLRMACTLKFFQGTKFNSVEDQDSSSQKSWYLVWDVGLFTGRTEAKAYLVNPSFQALTQHLQRSDTLEKWGLLCEKHHQDEEYGETVPDSEPEQTSAGEVSQAPTRARLARALPYPLPPNLIYGHTIKKESPLPLIKLELSPHQPSRSSSRVVRAMPTPNSNSPNASPVSGVSTQSSQPTNISVKEKQKALEGLSGLRSKSSKTAALGRRQGGGKAPQETSEEERGRIGKRKHSDEVGKDDGNVLKRLKKRIEKGAQPAQSAECSPTPPPRPKPRPIFKGR